MSRDIVDKSLVLGLVVAGWVEDELADELAGFVEDAHQ
jgi:hypothetical protein